MFCDSVSTWTASRNWYPIRVDVCITEGTKLEFWCFFRDCSVFEHCGWHIIYVKSNSEEVCKKYIDFPQKFAKIEDFKVDHSKKLLNFQNTGFLYRKSYSKFDGFWWLSMILVVFFDWSNLKSSIFANFWWKSIIFFTNPFRNPFGINNISSTKSRNAIRDVYIKIYKILQ